MKPNPSRNFLLSSFLFLLCFIIIVVSSPAYAELQSEKIVTVYLLIDEPKQLQQYVDDLNKIDKPNFNRVIFSFVKPTLTDYQSGSLANTGILGYFDEHDGNGAMAFTALKEAVDLSRQKHIETFLSVGGWNYSCNFEVYGKLRRLTNF